MGLIVLEKKMRLFFKKEEFRLSRGHLERQAVITMFNVNPLRYRSICRMLERLNYL